MKTLSVILLLLFSVFGSSASAGLFKCKDANGHTTYQQKACADEVESATELKVSTKTATKPYRATKKNTRTFRVFTAYENQKPAASACTSNRSGYADEFADAYKRFYEISEDRIERGRKMYEAGFVGISSIELRSLQTEAKAKYVKKLNAMSTSELDNFCVVQAAKLRMLSAQVTDRSSGYMEGDLDPEGND